MGAWGLSRDMVSIDLMNLVAMSMAIEASFGFTSGWTFASGPLLGVAVQERMRFFHGLKPRCWLNGDVFKVSRALRGRSCSRSGSAGLEPSYHAYPVRINYISKISK